MRKQEKTLALFKNSPHYELMQRGAIFYSPNFEFIGRNNRDKLLILLSDHSKITNYFFVLATSQEKLWRKKILGCHSADGYYFFPKNTDWFELDTWIVFSDIFEWDVTKLSSEFCQRNLLYKSIIKESNYRAVLNCIKGCPDVLRRTKAFLAC